MAKAVEGKRYVTFCPLEMLYFEIGLASALTYSNNIKPHSHTRTTQAKTRFGFSLIVLASGLSNNETAGV